MSDLDLEQTRDRVRELNSPFPYKALRGLSEPKRKRALVVY